MMKKEKEKEAEDARRDDRRKQMKFINSLRDEMTGISKDMLTLASDEDLQAACASRGMTVGS